jgi:TetR/AcrR family transcriptional regulator
VEESVVVTKHERSEATRTRLLHHGARIFARRGYDGTSLDAIAKAARVNKAMVKYHFGGKQGLYSAILLVSIRKAWARLAPARDSGLPPPERLRRFIACLMDAFGEAPEFPFIVLREEMSGGHRLDPGVMKEFIAFFELDRDILLAGIENKDFRKVDPHETHLTIVGSLAFFLASQPLRRKREGSGQLPASPSSDSYVEHLTALILKGLALS